MLSEATSAVMAALITGFLSFMGVLASNLSERAKSRNENSMRARLLDEKISELTREVRRHNAFAERIPRLEAEMNVVFKDIWELKKSEKDK